MFVHILMIFDEDMNLKMNVKLIVNIPSSDKVVPSQRTKSER